MLCLPYFNKITESNLKWLKTNKLTRFFTLFVATQNNTFVLLQLIFFYNTTTLKLILVL